jgi:hypothetical protein
MRTLLVAFGVATPFTATEGFTSVSGDGKLVIRPSPQHFTCTHNKNPRAIHYNHLSSLLFSSNPESSEDKTPRKDKNTGPKNDSTSRNEFSRTIRVSKWFAAMGGSSSTRGGGSKSVNLSISATESERYALATRFRLSNITALSAELVVQPALGMEGRRSEDNCIEARGTVSAQVKQTCVRTNEDFDVDLEFTFDTTLKAMAATSASGAMSAGEMEALNAAAQLDSGTSRKKKGNNKKHSVKTFKGGQSTDLDTTGLESLQNILMEYEVTNDIIEDESCFCTDGIVDVGEIVSQMFRSKLDPYPKKPGSVPVKYTFIETRLD